MRYPAHPPCITGLFMVRPVIERIAPQLSGSGKRIRRTTRHRFRIALFIKLKQLRLRPCICTIQRHIDRYISDDGNSVFCRIGMKRSPLSVKQILLKAVKPDLYPLLNGNHLQSRLIPIFISILPLCPAFPLMEIF